MDPFEQRRRKGVIQTRIAASLTVLLLLAVISGGFERPRLVASFVVVYVLLTIGLPYLMPRSVEWRRVRTVFDLLAISFLVWSTGGVESWWFLLYLFPILLAARSLGGRGSLVVTAVAMLGYWVAGRK